MVAFCFFGFVAFVLAINLGVFLGAVWIVYEFFVGLFCHGR